VLYKCSPFAIYHLTGRLALDHPDLLPSLPLCYATLRYRRAGRQLSERAGEDGGRPLRGDPGVPPLLPSDEAVLRSGDQETHGAGLPQPV